MAGLLVRCCPAVSPTQSGAAGFTDLLGQLDKDPCFLVLGLVVQRCGIYWRLSAIVLLL